MNGKERINRVLRHEPVDRMPIYEHFWDDTKDMWVKQGHIQPHERLEDHFGFDMQMDWTFDMMAKLDFEPEVLEETEDTILTKDGNGAILRRHKLHTSTPEHVDYTVKCREDWEREIKPYLLEVDERRIRFESYRTVKASADKAGRFFCWCGLHVFELMHAMCGHENLLIGMALDPDWVKDMVKVYSELLIKLQTRLFEREGYPDGIFYYEDMGYKHSPFFSFSMYKDIIQQGHIDTINYAHEHGLPVIMHSCGFVEPLLPGMIESGIDCLQALEVKAGMDLVKLYRQYGDQIAFMGGIDVRCITSNDRQKIDAELEEKMPALREKNGYMIHSDHSIPSSVEYDVFKYFIDTSLKLGTFK